VAGGNPSLQWDRCQQHALIISTRSREHRLERLSLMMKLLVVQSGWSQQIVNMAAALSSAHASVGSESLRMNLQRLKDGRDSAFDRYGVRVGQSARNPRAHLVVECLIDNSTVVRPHYVARRLFG